MSRKIKQILPLLFFAAGLIFLIRLIQNIGWNVLWETLDNIGVRLIIVLIFPISWLILQSWAWHRILFDDGHRVPFKDLFLNKLTGEAINTINPVNFIGGDPWRIHLLRHKVDITASAASVVIDRTVQIFSVQVLMISGMVCAAINLPLPKGARVLLGIFSLVMALFLMTVVYLQKRHALSKITNLLRKIGFKKHIERIEHKILEIDEIVGAFYEKHPLHFLEIFFLHFASRILGFVEIWMIARLLNIPVHFMTAFYLGTLTMIVNLIFTFIPSAMGVLEGGYTLLYRILGENPTHGLAIQLIRRMRTFFWITIGLVIIVIYRPQKVPGYPQKVPGY